MSLVLYCVKCGSETKPAEACPSCGHATVYVRKRNVCLSCGEEISGAYYPAPSPNNPPVFLGYQCERCYDGKD